jgi:hypothetical protein
MPEVARTNDWEQIMLSRSRHWLFSIPLTLCVAVLVGCQAEGTTEVSDRSVTASLADIDQLVSSLEKHHRRPFRKPHRDARARTMRRLVAKTDIMLADLGGEGIESAFSGQTVEGDTTQDAMGTLRRSLQDLKAAAQRGSTPGVVASFRQVKEEYGRAMGSRRPGD